jgi:hypothetical protein
LNAILANKSGRNSVVECQLPKLDVVGSSPIARSKCVALRFINNLRAFLLFLILVLCFIPVHSFCQITQDPDRPFGMGDVILLPGQSAYIGDLTHDAKIVFASASEHTLGGCIASQVGWFDSAPGLFFEGLAYPLAPIVPMRWMPASGPIEFLNFPASAWWGSTASTGAIQYRAFSVADESVRTLAGWGGTGGIWGGQCRYQDDFISLNGNFRHGEPAVSDATDEFLLLSRAQWLNNDLFTLESGFLGAQQVSNDYWYSFYSTFLFKGRNFQSFRLKPFYQSAKQSDQSARELGGMADYLFNLAGIGQVQLGAGLAYSFMDGTQGETQSDRQYLQSVGKLDALGNLMLDFAFRLDFSSHRDAGFSLLTGLKYPVGSFTLCCDFGKGVLATDSGDAIKGDFGIFFSPDEAWLAGIQYVRREMPGIRLNGGRLRLQAEMKGGFLFFRGILARLDEEALCPENGSFQYDTGGRVQWEVIRGGHLWIAGRVLSVRPLYCEFGGDYTVNNLGIFASAANPGDSTVSWPDADTPLGLVLKLGVEIGI